jgi:hypothetical protein
MIEIAVATLAGLALVVGPLVWRVAQDRSEARALSIWTGSWAASRSCRCR